jgi:hypothetical protein
MILSAHLLLVLLCAEAPYSEPGDQLYEDSIPAECAVSSEELVQAKNEYFKLTKEADRTKRNLALFALLAAVFKVLLSLTKLASSFFRSGRGKTVIRFSTLGIGVFVFLFSHLAAGESWLDSIILGACGPFSIVVHEYAKLLFPSKGKVDEGPTREEGSGPGTDEPTPG